MSRIKKQGTWNAYFIISLIGLCIRQFLLPNPFECFGDNAALLNHIAELVIHAITYTVVGLFYVRKSAPALGSIAYTVTYASMFGYLYLCGRCSFLWWKVLLLSIGVALIISGLFVLRWLCNHHDYD